VLIKGRPKAKVLCAPQKVAAIDSSNEKPNIFNRKNENSDARDATCRAGSNVRRAMACFTSNPKPLVNALLNAFQTIPSRTIYIEKFKGMGKFAYHIQIIQMFAGLLLETS
jgi:hypothetical protein